MVNVMVPAFSGASPSYTVVGSGRRQSSAGLCAVLLNRGGIYARNSYFKELENAGFDYVLSLEKAGERYDIEELGAQFPFVRFILFKEMPSVGERINIAAAEADTPLFFVLWNDFHPVLSLNAERVAENLLGKSDEGAPPSVNGHGGFGLRVCTVPIFQSPQFETFPCAAAPFVNGKKFETILFAPQKEGEPSLYPFDGAGVYDRERFLEMGGFDAGFGDAYWQLMDFGLRSWLWGNEIRCSQHLRFRLNGAVNSQSIASGKSYLRFFLKNLAPVIHSRPEQFPAGAVSVGGEADAHLPLKRFLPYLSASGGKPLSAMRDFAEARAWVRMNSERFVRSVDEVARLWVDG